MKKILITILSIFLLVSVVFARSVSNETEKVEMQDADRILLKGELGAGEFKIYPKDQDEAFIAEISYDPDDVEYWVESKTRRGKCIIDIGCDLNNSHSFDTEDNEWDMTLSTKSPIEIDLEIGACESVFALGGIPIEELSLDVGAASAEINFSEVNPIRLNEIDINAGASSFTMLNIGNANFENFSLSGGVGSFDLDFLGEYKGTSYINIEIGLGSAELVFPRNIPIHIRTDSDNWFSSIDINKRRSDKLYEVEDGLFESDDFEDADDRIIVHVSVGLGSVNINFRK